MSQEDDERIAKTLLDLSARSSRVQIRNGMVYLGGYALGNGTVEIRSQVARDRRRRFTPVAGYAAAILYEVLNGTNSEIWLQDNGGAPVLITTLPTRIDLGWTSTVQALSSDRRLGFVMSRDIDGILIDTELDFPDAPTQRLNDANIIVSATGNEIGGDLVRIPGGEALPSLINRFSATPFEGRIFYGGRIGQQSILQLEETEWIHRPVNLSLTGSHTITIESLANQVSVYLQKRQANTYIYLRHKPFHSLTVPTPPRDTGDVWMEFQFWHNGTIETDPSEPLDGDITGFIVDEPYKFVYPVDETNPALSSANVRIYNARNVVSIRPYLDYQVSSFPLEGFLSKGAAIDVPFVEGHVQLDKDNVLKYVGTEKTARFKGVPANARQVLSVAVYPVDG